jgi:hypothetical protein
VHGHYARAEIEAAHCYAEACGYGVLSTESPWIHREGVLAHQASATDLLFITLHKSEALFSPSTRCRDLALGPALFHWESQSTTTASSPTGQRDVHHAERGSRVLLYRCAEACGYVREQRKQDGRPGAPPNPSCVWGLRAAKATRVSGRWRGGISVAAGAGDPGGVAARLLCCTPAVAWHSGGVGGLRASVIGRPAHSCCRTELSRIFSASLSPRAI